MTGYNDILKLRHIEKECSELGFTLCNPRINYGYDSGSLVSIKPKDCDALPVYARDAELFVGTLENLEMWLRGVEWARQYDHLLGLSNTKKRSRKEQDRRNLNIIRILKNEGSTKIDS